MVPLFQLQDLQSSLDIEAMVVAQMVSLIPMSWYVEDVLPVVIHCSRVVCNNVVMLLHLLVHLLRGQHSSRSSGWMASD